MRSIKRMAAALMASGALVATAAAPASAHPGHGPVVTGGLVNVTIVDFADVNVEDVTVQIPVAAAANVCDINAAILIAAIEDTGSADCDATATSNANA